MAFRVIVKQFHPLSKINGHKLLFSCRRYSSYLNSDSDIGDNAIKNSEKLSQNSTPEKFFKDVPGVQTNVDKYALMYTCKICDSRSVKSISKQAYHKGCVVVKCPGCKNMHLISDNLGIFDEPGWNLESYFAERGQLVKRFDKNNILELSIDDIAGDNSLIK